MNDFSEGFLKPAQTKPVKFIRVDDRLIHGQVIVGWLPFLKVHHVYVVNERIASDSFRQEMMLLSIPPQVTLNFFSTKELVQNLTPPSDSMILVTSPKDAWFCIEAGVTSEVVNIGGMHAKPGKKEVFDALHLDDEDRLYLRKLLTYGINLVFQPTPQNDPVPLNDIF